MTDSPSPGPPATPSWSQLPTEARHPASSVLDTLPTGEIVALLIEEDRRGLERTLERAADIARAAEWLAETLAGDGSTVLAGAGTSGRLGIVEAAECPPTFGTDPQRVRAVIAGGRDAVFAAREGAEDRGDEGRAVAGDLGAGDLMIGLSASSVTPFTRGALEAARERGARTVLLTCAAADGLEDTADLVIALDTGPEILTGSTRLKAGSATKAALNAITTAAMVRAGKVFENLMVDLRPGSAKLRDRAVRILRAASGLSGDAARTRLDEAAGELKTAIVMSRRGVDAEQARELLRTAGGHVRAALKAKP
ncbi:MAG TPA: N-acetylmuramic acid 6-phosphate etherase [Thermoanaerobaculia bacterium]|nr:N-acetylmuramic acid 6-phosphate etherase [Thermoanaerobaculia bacterium]